MIGESKIGMLDTRAAQIEVIANRRRRGWDSAHNLSCTTEGLAEELGEFTKARRKGDPVEEIDALGDMIVWCLGGLEILGADAAKVVSKIIEKNAGRTYTESNHY